MTRRDKGRWSILTNPDPGRERIELEFRQFLAWRRAFRAEFRPAQLLRAQGDALEHYQQIEGQMTIDDAADDAGDQEQELSEEQDATKIDPEEGNASTDPEEGVTEAPEPEWPAAEGES